MRLVLINDEGVPLFEWRLDGFGDLKRIGPDLCAVAELAVWDETLTELDRGRGMFK